MSIKKTKKASSILYGIYTMNNVPPTKVWTDLPILTMTRSYRLKKKLWDSMHSMILLLLHNTCISA